MIMLDTLYCAMLYQLQAAVDTAISAVHCHVVSTKPSGTSSDMKV
jgi:hypothetical protein